MHHNIKTEFFTIIPSSICAFLLFLSFFDLFKITIILHFFLDLHCLMNKKAKTCICHPLDKSLATFALQFLQIEKQK